MLLIDTSGLLAAVDTHDPQHMQCMSALLMARGPLVMSPFVLAEVDYMVNRQSGQRAMALVLDDVESGAYQLETVTAADVGRAHAVTRRHHDLKIGLADASIVVLAERHGIGDVLTLDQRHFRVLSWLGNPFRILPADADEPTAS